MTCFYLTNNILLYLIYSELSWNHYDYYGAFPLHGTARYGSLLGGFPLSTVPGTWYFFSTFLVPPRLGFQAIRTVTKTWRVNSTDHWLAGENHHYCITELATLVPTIDPLDLNQHSQRGIRRSICLNKRNFSTKFRGLLRKVCWGSTDVPLIDRWGADPARAWWCDAEWKSFSGGR